jgi:hypothetical protein
MSEGRSDDGNQKRGGVFFITLAFVWVAIKADMDWWEVALIGAMAFWGCHQLAGIKVKFWG